MAAAIMVVVERKKCRDYYDVWQLMKLNPDKVRVRKLVAGKFQYKGMEFKGLREIFPEDIFGVLEGYWERELGRLINPVPELEGVIHELKSSLRFFK